MSNGDKNIWGGLWGVLKKAPKDITLGLVIVILLFLIGVTIAAFYQGREIDILGVVRVGPKADSTSEKTNVAGHVTIDGLENNMGIIIGIIPGSYMTYTESDGSFNLPIRKETGESYKVIAIHKGNIHLEGLTYDTALNNFVFKHCFKNIGGRIDGTPSKTKR